MGDTSRERKEEEVGRRRGGAFADVVWIVEEKRSEGRAEIERRDSNEGRMGGWKEGMGSSERKEGEEGEGGREIE